MNAIQIRRPAQTAATEKRTGLRLWLPLTPIFLALAPLALLIAQLINPFTVYAMRVNALYAAARIGGVLMSLGGTIIEIDSPRLTYKLRIF